MYLREETSPESSRSKNFAKRIFVGLVRTDSQQGMAVCEAARDVQEARRYP